MVVVSIGDQRETARSHPDVLLSGDALKPQLAKSWHRCGRNPVWLFKGNVLVGWLEGKQKPNIEPVGGTNGNLFQVLCLRISLLS